MNKLIFITLISFICTFFLKNESKADIWAVNFTLNGSKVVPPVTTNGLGTVAGTYNDVTNELYFTITFSGLTGITLGGHFHGPASVTENAGTIINWTGFPLGVSSGSYSNTFILDEVFETVLLQGRMYADIHTSFAFNGEIRSQVSSLIRMVRVDYLIEAMYNPSLNKQVRDTLTLNLRSSTSPYTFIEGRKAVLDSTGRAIFLPWALAPSFTPYYLQILHRNALETWSSSTVIWNTTWLVEYNFKNLITKAYGNNMILVDDSPVSYAVYSGDVNHDGTIDISDVGLIGNAASVFASGYLDTDLNGDGITDVADIVFADNNSFNFISKITP
ncbi:MAG TPA: CHRD domain-containing protein [Ignavibacteria bacterium]|nr:hypothetical protein [Bacteroidota bacterium]HRI86202.1 CHRD domain-containing protein [Ignavibacteria bacterium]HRJ99409.1 CHRD domain-containing protein [Ignavibacteria bacterium]